MKTGSSSGVYFASVSVRQVQLVQLYLGLVLILLQLPRPL